MRKLKVANIAWQWWGGESSDLEHVGICFLRWKKDSWYLHSLLVRKRHKRLWRFYRQHVPFSVVLFQSIYQVMKNIFWFEWVQEQEKTILLVQVAVQAALPLGSPNAADPVMLEICGGWVCCPLKPVTDNSDGKVTFLRILSIKKPVHSLSIYYFGKYSWLIYTLADAYHVLI